MSTEKLALIALILSTIAQAANVWALVRGFVARTVEGKRHKGDHDEQIEVLTRIAVALEDRPSDQRNSSQ